MTPAREPFNKIGLAGRSRIGTCDFGAISVKKKAAPSQSLKWRVTYRIGVYTMYRMLAIYGGTRSYPVWPKFKHCSLF